MKTKFISFFLLCLLCLSGCINNEIKYKSADIFAMDTFVNIVYQSDSNDIKDIAEDELERIENIFSKTISDSEIYMVNTTPSQALTYECSEVLEKCLEIAYATEGAYNPALGQIVGLWDINSKKYIPSEQEITSLLPLCDYKTIQIFDNTITKEYPETYIDLGASVKGYAAKKIIDLLSDNGVKNAMISIGGNIAVAGEAYGRDGYWRVGIKNPFKPDEIAGYIDCTDKIISVSGDYERFFEKDGIIYHHIFDSTTGYPADTDIKSVAVIAEDGLISDAMSTALFCMGVDKALEFYQKDIYEFEAVIIRKDAKVVLTDGIKEDFTLSNDSMLFIMN